MIESETCVLEKTSTGPSTLGSKWWRMIGQTPAPLARAAATNSSDFTCTVADSATRTTRGTKTTESEITRLRALLPQLEKALRHGLATVAYHESDVKQLMGELSSFYKRLLDGQELVVYGDGTQQRDFLFVADLMHGIERAIGSAAGGVFQLGSGRGTPVNALIDAMRSVVGAAVPVRVRHEPARAGEVKNTWCNIDKARREFGFDPRTPLREGLTRTWAWFQAKKSAA